MKKKLQEYEMGWSQAEGGWMIVKAHTLEEAEEKFENGAVVNAEVLLQMGILSKIEEYGLKVLGDGELTKSLTLQANKFTESSAQKIEKAGGKAEVL